MNGLKVYLKSSITKVYHYLQLVIGLTMILNALREYEHIQSRRLAMLLNVVAGVALVTNWVMPRTVRRKLRLLPGLLLFAAGTTIIYYAKVSLAFEFSQFHTLFQWVGFGVAGIGISHAMLDVNHVVYFNSSGMLYKSTLFWSTQKKWSEIKGFVFQEQGFTVELMNKRTYRMVPYDAESQNLRVYLDKMLHVAKAGKGNAPTGNQEISHLSSETA